MIMGRKRFLSLCFIGSEREKHSASNESIFIYFQTNLDRFLSQKLAFRSPKKTLDFSYYSNTFENKLHIYNQHILFYHFMKIINGLTTKKIPISGRKLRQKKLGYHRV